MMVIVQGRDKVADVTFGHGGAWFIRFDGGWHGEKLSEELLWELHQNESGVLELSLGVDDNRWWVQFKDGSCKFCNLSTECHRLLSRWTAKCVTFFKAGGCFIMFSDGSSQWHGIPNELAALAERYRVEMVAAAPGGWFASFSDGSWEHRGLPVGVGAHLTRRSDVRSLAVASDGSWFLAVDGRVFWSVRNAKLDGLLDPEPLALRPADIGFTHGTIAPYFQAGNSIYEAIEQLEDGWIQASSFPAIKVFWHEREWWSLDNRRLYVFQQAGVPLVPVDVVDRGQVTITGDGSCPVVRG